MRSLLIIPVLILSVGCKPAPKINQYKAEPEAVAPTANAPAVASTSTPAPAPPMVAPESMKAEAASFSEPKWGTLPAGWSVGPENAMRKATFVIAGKDGTKAEVAVTVFPGSVGGLSANVNRWRGQIGLSPASEEEINTLAQPTKVGPDAGQRFILVSLDGKKSTDAAMIPKNGATWFFKLSGDATIVQANNAAFTQFLATSQIP